jgi:hypothetical protein
VFLNINIQVLYNLGTGNAWHSCQGIYKEKGKMDPLQIYTGQLECPWKSIHQLTRQQKISVAKLVHGLANTNHQNPLSYNTSPLCPICNAVEETFEHVLTFKHPSTTSFRDACLLQMDKELKQKIHLVR